MIFTQKQFLGQFFMQNQKIDKKNNLTSSLCEKKQICHPNPRFSTKTVSKSQKFSILKNIQQAVVHLIHNFLPSPTMSFLILYKAQVKSYGQFLEKMRRFGPQLSELHHSLFHTQKFSPIFKTVTHMWGYGPPPLSIRS